MGFINYDIKMEVTPEQSEKVQKICFENNIGWGDDGEFRLQLTKVKYLFIYTKEYQKIRWSDDLDVFESSQNELVDAEIFIECAGVAEKMQQLEQNNTTGIIFEIIEPTSNNKTFIKSLNLLFEKYKDYHIDVQYNTTYVNKFYKGALLIISPLNKII